MKNVLRAICAQYVQPMHELSSTYVNLCIKGLPFSDNSTCKWEESFVFAEKMFGKDSNIESSKSKLVARSVTNTRVCIILIKD
tara:strand:+ start:984 stop:1232 length:249 start_codon:yes stop_codon:yes gene_type:complete